MRALKWPINSARIVSERTRILPYALVPRGCGRPVIRAVYDLQRPKCAALVKAPGQDHVNPVVVVLVPDALRLVE